jgi:hypothetical protein
VPHHVVGKQYGVRCQPDLPCAVQGWHLTAQSEHEWLVNFKDVVGMRLSLPLGSPTASGQLEMLTAAAAPLPYSSNSMARDLLQALGEPALQRLTFIYSNPTALRRAQPGARALPHSTVCKQLPFCCCPIKTSLR